MTSESIAFVKDFSGSFVQEQMPRKIPARESSFNSMVEKFYGSGDKMRQNISKLNDSLNFLFWRETPESFKDSRAIKLREASMENALFNSNLINSTFTFGESEPDNVITGTNDLIVKPFEEDGDKVFDSNNLDSTVNEGELNLVSDEPISNDVEEEFSSTDVSSTVGENEDVDNYDYQGLSLDMDEETNVDVRLPRGGNAVKMHDFEEEPEKAMDDVKVDRITLPKFPSFSEMFVPVDVSFNNKKTSDDTMNEREMPVVVDDNNNNKFNDDVITYSESANDYEDIKFDQSDDLGFASNQGGTKELLLSIQEKLEKLSAATKMAGDAKKALDEQEEARKRSDEILKDKTRAIIEMSHSLDGDIAAVTEETRKYEISLDEQRRLLEENNQVISEIDTIIANSRSITRR